jgi:hypothetical protein
MIDKFTIYRFIAPFRSRLQGRLRSQRLKSDIHNFELGVETGCVPGLARELWTLLQDSAFIPDFRPAPDDNLADVYAMGPEEVRDDIIEPLLNKLGLKVDHIDFTGFNFARITTPRDIAAFVVRVAALQYVGCNASFLNGGDQT